MDEFPSFQAVNVQHGSAFEPAKARFLYDYNGITLTKGVGAGHISAVKLKEFAPYRRVALTD